MPLSFVRFTVLALVASTALADTYVVPIYGFVQGASGSYGTALFVTNPNDAPVTVSVGELYPLLSRDCHAVGCSPIQVTIAPHGSTPLADIINDGSTQLSLGAFTLNSTLPIFMQAWVLTYPPDPQTCNVIYRQQVPILRGWSPGGIRSWLPEALGLPGQGTNVFIVNPNSFPIRVGYSVGYDMPEQSALVIAAKSTALQRLTTPVGAPVSPTPINLFSSEQFYALSSNGVIIQPLVAVGGSAP